MDLNRETIVEAVLDSVAETLNMPLAELSEDTLIREDLDADSMDVVTLMVLLDDKFDAEFNPEDIPAEDVSIRWVVDYIIKKLNSSANGA
jgi:acyl carrier protein